MVRTAYLLLAAIVLGGCRPADPSDAKLKADFMEGLDKSTRPYLDVDLAVVEKRQVAEDRLHYVLDVTLVRNQVTPPTDEIPLLRSLAATEQATARFGVRSPSGSRAVLLLSPQGASKTQRVSADYLFRDGAWVIRSQPEGG